MPQIFFSKGTNSFYDPEINTIIPADAVEVPVAVYETIMLEHMNGGAIASDAAGAPVIVTQESLWSLAQVKEDALGKLLVAYRTAIASGVTFTTSGGVSKQFQSDAQSTSNLQDMLLAFSSSQAVPQNFYWVSQDNTKVPFTYADLQQLALVMGDAGFAAFNHYQTKKEAVLACSDAQSVLSVGW